jgi:hypothetical protein
MKTSTRIAVVVLAGIGLTACSDAATTSGSAVTTTTTTAPAPTATTAAAAPTTTTAPKPTGVYPLGTTVKVPVTIDGIASALVTAVYPNATSQSQFDTPDAGTTYFAADATECAGSKGSSTYVQFSGTSASFSDADSVVKWPAS